MNTKPKKKSIEELMAEKNLDLISDHDKYKIISDNKQIWININQKNLHKNNYVVF